MPSWHKQRWGLYLLAIVLAGLLSRSVQSGSVLLNKYLGDALYAAMLYAALRCCGVGSRHRPAAAFAAGLGMLLIECFQLTGIAESMLRHGHMLQVLLARLLGTTFGLADLLAYAVGIASIWALDEWKQL